MPVPACSLLRRLSLEQEMQAAKQVQTAQSLRVVSQAKHSSSHFQVETQWQRLRPRCLDAALVYRARWRSAAATSLLARTLLLNRT